MQTKDAQIWGCISFMASPRSGGLHFCSGRFLLPSHDALFSARRRQKGVRWRRRHWRRRLLRSAKNAGSKFQLLLLDQRSKERDFEQDEKFLNSALIVEADLKFKEKKCASLELTELAEDCCSISVISSRSRQKVCREKKYFICSHRFRCCQIRLQKGESKATSHFHFGQSW